jgi:hypothetical protein
VRTLMSSLIVGALASMMSVGTANAQTPKAKGLIEMYSSLETAASKTNGLDRNSVSNLVDEVFKYPTLAQLPSALTTGMKNRIVDGEVAHRQGHGPGITDERLSQVFNDGVDKFGFPDYAHTSPAMFRVYRTRLATRMPTFLGSVRPAATKGDSVDDLISPAQAAYLVTMMADQKLMMPFWQKSPADWDPNAPIERPSGVLPGQGEATPQGIARLTISAGGNPKTNEMRAIAAKSMGNMSAADAVDLVDQSLKKLGL